MSKLSITGGIVSLEDGIKAKEEFAPARKARVELHFDIPVGADHDAHVQGVADVARSHLHRILHNTAAPVVAHIAAVTGGEKAPAEPTKPETAAQKKARLAAEKAAGKPAEKTKADLEREHLESLGGKPAAAKTDDELLAEDEPEITAAGKTVAAEEDDLDDLLGETAPTPITDLELANAVQKKNAERKEADPNWAPAKIRDVISTYSGGKRVNDIPAAKRAEFLKKIEALK